MVKKKRVKRVVAKVKHKPSKPKQPVTIEPVATRELPPQPVPEVKVEPKEVEEIVEETVEEPVEEERPEPKRSSHNKFVVGEAIEFGWDSVKSHLWFFIGIFLIFFVILFMIFGAKGVGTRVVLGVLVTGVSLGYIKLAVDIVDNKDPEFKELFSCFSLLLQYLLSLIIYVVIVSVGLVLFVIPGLIWAVQFGFFPFVIVNERLWPLNALRKSSALTEGVKGRLIVFGLVLLGINLLGLLAVGIGIIVTIPLSIIAAAHIFRQLESA